MWLLLFSCDANSDPANDKAARLVVDRPTFIAFREVFNKPTKETTNVFRNNPFVQMLWNEACNAGLLLASISELGLISEDKDIAKRF